MPEKPAPTPSTPPTPPAETGTLSLWWAGFRDRLPKSFPKGTPKGMLKGLSGRISRTTMIIVGVAVGVVLVLGVGAWAVYSTFLGSDGGVADSSKALPAHTVMMAEFSIEPSTQQKLLLVQLGKRLNGMKDLIDSTDSDVTYFDKPGTELRPILWDNLVDGLDIDTNLRYDDDIAPWLGGRLAIGLVGDQGDVDTSWIVVIESRNDEKGVDAVEEFLDDALGDAARDLQVEARNGYIIVAHEDLDLDDAFSDGVLADQPAFKESAGKLGSRGLASYWYSPYATTEAMIDWVHDSDRGASKILADALDDIPMNSGQATVVRAFDDGLEIQSYSSGTGASPSLKAGGNAIGDIGALPDTTAMAFSLEQMGSLFETGLTPETLASGLAESLFTGGSYYAEDMYSSLTGEYSSDVSYDDLVSAWTEDLRSTIEDAVNLDIPDEFNAAFGRGVIFSMDGTLDCDGFDLDNYYDDCNDPRMALIVRSQDIGATEDAVDELLDKDTLREADLEIVTADDDSRLVIGRGDYIDDVSVDASDSLADLPEFHKALPDAGSATVAMYLSVQGLLDLIDDQGGDLSRDAIDAIEDFAAFGISGSINPDGTATSRMRIVLADN